MPCSPPMMAGSAGARISWVGDAGFGARPSALVVHLTSPRSRTTSRARRDQIERPLRVGGNALMRIADPARASAGWAGRSISATPGAWCRRAKCPDRLLRFLPRARLGDDQHAAGGELVQRVVRALDHRQAEPRQQFGDAGVANGGARIGAGAGRVGTADVARAQEEQRYGEHRDRACGPADQQSAREHSFAAHAGLSARSSARRACASVPKLARQA